MVGWLYWGFLTQVLTQLSFQSHQLLFSHASALVIGENTPERKFALTRSPTHNHQVMSLTRSPLSHPGGAKEWTQKDNSHYSHNGEKILTYIFYRNQTLYLVSLFTK